MAQNPLDIHGWDNDGELILTGSADAYVARPARAINGYYQGLRLCGKANFTNAGAATLEIFGPNSSTGLGAVAVRKLTSATLVSGDMVSGQYYDFAYDAVNGWFQLLNPSSASSVGGFPLTAPGDRWGVLSPVKTDGGMEIGQYIDFHNSDADVTDFAVRLGTGGTTTDLFINNSLPITTTATAAQIRSAATGNLAVTAASIETASALVTLTDAATIAIDWDSFVSASLVIAGNRTLGNPTNGQGGTYRTFYIAGNDGTLRSLAFDTFYHGALPALADITSGKTYLITIFCVNTTFFVLKVTQAFP